MRPLHVLRPRVLVLVLALVMLACGGGQPPGGSLPPDGGTPDGGAAQASCTTCPAGQVCGGGGIPSRCGTLVPVCTDGICWSNPLPQGNTLHGVWARSRRDVYAVGEVGTILHWDGERMQAMESPTRRTLRAVWGTAAGPDVWAVGEDSVILRYDGSRWALEYGPREDTLSTDLWAVHGTGSGDVWAVGSQGRVLHRTTTGWVTASQAAGTTSLLTGVFAVSPSDVYVVGGGAVSTPVLLHWDGRTWTSEATPDAPWAVWASGPDDVWVVGRGGTFGGLTYHWDGTRWRESSTTGTGSAISGSSPSNVWVVGDTRTRHFDGTEWTTFELPQYADLNAVTVAADDAVWAVGENGELWFHDGKEWAAVSSGQLYMMDKFLSVSAAGGHVWAVGRNVIGHFDGTRWLLDREHGAVDVAAVAADDVWFAGAGSSASVVLHWNGSTLTTELDASTGSALPDIGALSRIWAGPGGEVWAFGSSSGKALRRTAGTWSVVDLPLRTNGARAAVYDVASGEAGLYLVGDEVMRFDGTQWVRVEGAPAGPLFSVWVGSEVWLGASDAYFHGTGSSFSEVAAPLGTTVGGLTGIAPADVYALTRRVGSDLGTRTIENPVLMRWSGTEWEQHQPPARFISGYAAQAAGDGFAEAGVWMTVGSQTDYGGVLVFRP